jgi:Uma2 family endonuclease
MADNTEQYRWIVTIAENLEFLFRNHNDVFIAADLLWYPVRLSRATEDKTKKSLAPDVMVVFGRPKGKRKSYKQWNEDNIPPLVVFEILSESNTDTEMAEKLLFYQQHGVQEYYIYDPETYVLEVRVRQQSKLVEITEVNGWVSPRLGIKFDLSQGELVIYHPNDKKFLPPLQTSIELEIQHQRAEEEHQRAEEEHQRAEEERQRAEEEHQRAEELATYLRSLGIDPDNLPKICPQ